MRRLASLLASAWLVVVAPGCDETGEDASGGSDAGSALPDAGQGGTAGSPGGAWRFVMVGDTHITATEAPLPDLIPAIAGEEPALVLVAGDVVQTGKGTTPEEMKQQLAMFHQTMQPLYAKQVPVYPVRGNHENDATGSASAWRASFAGDRMLPTNGPAGEDELSYSVPFRNALFVAVDEYVAIHQVNQPWLDSVLASNTLPHVFVFGHEPAFKYFHTDCMDNAPEARNAFWASLAGAGARVYLAGHDHLRDLSRIDDGDGNPENDLYQYLVGTGGGPFPPTTGGLTGNNAPFAPVSVSHSVEYGYLLVEVSGEGAADRDVTMTFKRRTCDGAETTCEYTAASDVFRYTAPARTP
jgi:hypothetical protein